MRSLMIAAASAIALSGTANAAIVTLDFEGQSAGTIIDSEYAPLVTISTSSNGSNDAAVIFDTNNPTGNDADLGGPFENTGFIGPDFLSPGNVLVISEDARGITCGIDTCSTPDDEAQGGVISFMFSEAVNFLGFDVFDVTDGGSTLTVDVYDIFGAFITTIGSPPFEVGDNQYARASGFLGNVGRLDFIFTGSGAIDNLIFETSEVPIPGALPLLLTGIAGLSLSRRKKRTA